MDFEYEVAFSFCSEDEDLALAIDDRFKDRFKTFIYTRRQGEIVGSDGAQLFPGVFGVKARVVVILLRERWGTRGFTLIEKTAIQNRVFQHGAGFTLWIALESEVKLPPWVEVTRIYYSLPTLGIDGAVGAIETCIQQAGGNTRPETLAEKAARLKRQVDAQDKRLAFLRSHTGVEAAGKAGLALLQTLEAGAKELVDWNFQVEASIQRGIVYNFADVMTDRRALGVTWYQPHGNTLDRSELRIELWQGPPNRPGRYFVSVDAPPCDHTESFGYDRTLWDTEVWENRSTGKQIAVADMADHLLGMLLDAINKDRMREKR